MLRYRSNRITLFEINSTAAKEHSTSLPGLSQGRAVTVIGYLYPKVNCSWIGKINNLPMVRAPRQLGCNKSERQFLLSVKFNGPLAGGALNFRLIPDQMPPVVSPGSLYPNPSWIRRLP